MHVATGGTPPGINYIISSGEVCIREGSCHFESLFYCSSWLSLFPFFSPSLFFFSIFLLGGFMLTEAVCSQHRLRCLEEGRHAAENERGQEKSHLCQNQGMMGFCTIRPRIHNPNEINQNGNPSPTQTLQWERHIVGNRGAGCGESEEASEDGATALQALGRVSCWVKINGF